MIHFALALALQSAPMHPHPKGYVCHRAETPIVIDGKLDDEAWRRAPWTNYFVDIEGDRKPRPRFKTRAKMLWDETYFYIAAEMEEPHVWATLTEHDSVIFHDNDFEVFIDPDGDNHQYYEFEINALNTGWDLRLPKPYRDGGPALNEWEIPGLKTRVHVAGTLNDPSDRDKGWSVEIAFPWKVLGEFAGCSIPPREGDQWRVNFSRVEWLTDIVDGKYVKVKGKAEDNWVWSPQHAIDMHRPEYWGYVQFTSRPAGTVRFEKDPTWAARMRLMDVYYAQKSYLEKHKRWAESLSALKFAGSTVRLAATSSGWEAETEVRRRNGERVVVKVREDSRLLVEGR
jgi:hypothetical protein